MSKKKKPYFPNNWQAYANCPAEMFDSLPIEQFFDWRVEGWEIPSSVAAIIREQDLESGHKEMIGKLFVGNTHSDINHPLNYKIGKTKVFFAEITNLEAIIGTNHIAANVSAISI